MFEKLTASQRANLRDLASMQGIEAAFMGVDEALRPVVMIRDSEKIVSYAIAVDGRGVDIGHPVRRLTDDEVESLAEWDSIAIFGLEWTLA